MDVAYTVSAKELLRDLVGVLSCSLYMNDIVISVISIYCNVQGIKLAFFIKCVMNESTRAY